MLLGEFFPVRDAKASGPWLPEAAAAPALLENTLYHMISSLEFGLVFPIIKTLTGATVTGYGCQDKNFGLDGADVAPQEGSTHTISRCISFFTTFVLEFQLFVTYRFGRESWILLLMSEVGSFYLIFVFLVTHLKTQFKCEASTAVWIAAIMSLHPSTPNDKSTTAASAGQ